jgi:hypothetical protein
VKPAFGGYYLERRLCRRIFFIQRGQSPTSGEQEQISLVLFFRVFRREGILYR